jgi:hypothetical protein
MPAPIILATNQPVSLETLHQCTSTHLERLKAKESSSSHEGGLRSFLPRGTDSPGEGDRKPSKPFVQLPACFFSNLRPSVKSSVSSPSQMALQLPAAGDSGGVSHAIRTPFTKASPKASRPVKFRLFALLHRRWTPSIRSNNYRPGGSASEKATIS